MGKVAKTSADESVQLTRLNRELAESADRFRSIIEQNADAIVVVDHEGVLRFLNDEAAKLFGGNAEDLVGSHFGFPLVGGETTELDLVRNGEARTVEMRVVDSKWSDETAYIASLRDITERKRSEQDARQLIREHAARNAAEDVARRFRILADSTALLSASLDFKETVRALAQVCTAELADWVVVFTCGKDRTLLRVEVAHRDPAKAAIADALRGLSVDQSQSEPIRQVIETGAPVLWSSMDETTLPNIMHDEYHRQLLSELGITSLMLVPMVARNTMLGAIKLVSSDPRRHYTPEDLTLAVDLASRAALAIDNARLYEEAREANRTKSELLAIISHDLRTPLNSIIGYGQLMEMDIPDKLTPASRERIERMLMSARHQLYLLDELLAYARLDTGHESVQPQRLDLRTVVREAASLVEPLANERGLNLRTDIPQQAIITTTDPDKLRQILLNLLSNAVNYTPQGEIALSVGATDAAAVIEVADTGIGISPEHVKHIFEPFWQVDSTQRGRRGGTGLGLNVVQQVAQLLGATVSVASEVGRGTTFTVALPIPSEQPSTEISTAE